MKTQLLLAVFLGLALSACSSSKKNDSESKVEEKMEKAAESTKETAKKMVNEAKAKMDGETQCKLGGDVRTIGVKAVDNGCEVIYTKFGESNSIASGSKGSEHCVNVVSKVKDNLENAGFKCE
ncbi:MAG TPA: hypothetical protein DCL41_05765 [Bdellovibrionales bacterium]|nr:hypothetical protein [Pseudobdellovibrionaceae bacterium]HAG91356.1 hypothetical protein [Bdellovibrionales bacterium]|tara:strand:+ start:810 stop:1178 length:369 start_codon:yes stop_codon:yes gene_type:complete